MSVITLTRENFKEEVLGSSKPILVDFWASWCGPCRMVSPIVDEIGEEFSEIAVGKVNVDEQPELAHDFGVENIPTLMLFKDGKLMDKHIGAMGKSDLLDFAGL